MSNKNWDKDSINNSFRIRVDMLYESLSKYKNNIDKNISTDSYKKMYDETLAEIYIKSHFLDKIFLNSKETFIKELQILDKEYNPTILGYQYYDKDLFLNQIKIEIKTTIEKYSK